MKIFYLTENYLLKTIEMSINEEGNYYCVFPERVFIMGATEENEDFVNALNDLERQFLPTFSPSTLKDSSAIDIEYFRRKNSILEFVAPEQPYEGFSLVADIVAQYIWVGTTRDVANNIEVYEGNELAYNQNCDIYIPAHPWIFSNAEKRLSINPTDNNPNGTRYQNTIYATVDPDNASKEVFVNTMKCNATTIGYPSVGSAVGSYPLDITTNQVWNGYPDVRVFHGLGNPPPGVTMTVEGEIFTVVIDETYQGEPYDLVTYIRDRELNQEIFRKTITVST